MALSLEQMGQDPAYERFLSAIVGEDTKGIDVSVISMLARLEIDPWAEASELAAMSEGPAHKRLRALIARFHDVPTLGPDQGKAISALLDLLPRSRSATNPTPPDQPGTPRRFALGVPIYWYIAGFLLLGWIVNLAQFQ